MIKKIFLLVVTIVVIGGIAYLVPFIMVLFSTDTEVEEISFPKYNEKLYLRNEKRGLNYEVTAIMTSPKGKISREKNKSFVYVDGGTLFYKTTKDTLFVYTTMKAETPKDIETRIIIRQIEISNIKFIEMNKEYDKIGLRKFPSN